MIKKLIEDLATEKISITSALTQGKIIASKLKNEVLKNWIQNELNGYDNDTEVPDYRVFKIQIKGDVVGPFGFRQNGVVIVLDAWAKKLGFDPYTHRETFPIHIIENSVVKPQSLFLIKPFNHRIVKILNNELLKNDGNEFISVGKYISINDYQHVVQQTKQKLIDLLLQLDEEFPHFDMKFQLTDDTQERANSIVNLNIFGSGNNTTLGVGKKVSQRDINQSASTFQELEDKLNDLSVPTESITELKEILKNESKESQSKKVMSWVGSLTKKMIEKGIELKLPEIIDTVQAYI